MRDLLESIKSPADIRKLSITVLEELAEAIRMLDPGTPVILITAYGSSAFEDIASHPAISHYIHKPFHLDRLLQLVGRCAR